MHKSRANVYATVIIAILAATSLAVQPQIPASIFFVANEGQWDEPFTFKLSTGGTTYFLTETGMTLDIRQYERVASERRGMPGGLDAMDPMGRDREPEPISVRGHVLKMDFVNANPHPQLVGQDKLASYSNYFLGRDSCRWRSRVGHYQRVIARNVWSGIDVEFVADAQGVKTNYHVHPGADVSQIQIEYEGLDAPLRVDGSGDLVLATSLGDLKEQAPWAYQINGRQQRDVGVQFAVLNANRCGILASSVDASKELVIDPLVYGSLIGGSRFETVVACEVDSDGQPVLIGGTNSANFPTTPGAYQPEIGSGNMDAYISKFTFDGRQLVFSTFLGGPAHEWVADGTLADDGTIIIAGNYENAGGWPLTSNAFDTISAGARESFIGQLSGDGTTLMFASYLGGSGVDVTFTARSHDGLVYVCGFTRGSTDFPTTSGSMFPIQSLAEEGFITVIDPIAGQIEYSTFYPAGSWCDIVDCEVESPFLVWIEGIADSMAMTTPDAVEPDYPGSSYNSFLARVDLAENSTEYCTYLPGSGRQIVTDYETNGEQLVVLGLTDAADFPTTPGAFDSTGPEYFLLKIALPNTITTSTFLDGLITPDFVVNTEGNVVLAGTVNDSFPVTPSSFDTVYRDDFHEGEGEGLFVVMNSMLTGLDFASYAGGDWSDGLGPIAMAESNVYWTAGGTNSVNFPTTPDAFQPALNGQNDMVLMRWDFRNTADPPRRYDPTPSIDVFVYPNPFNDETRIRYTLAHGQRASLFVHDLLGRQARSLDLGWMTAGTHRIALSFAAFPSGVYTITLHAGSWTASQRAVLIK